MKRTRSKIASCLFFFFFRASFHTKTHIRWEEHGTATHSQCWDQFKSLLCEKQNHNKHTLGHHDACIRYPPHLKSSLFRADRKLNELLKTLNTEELKSIFDSPINLNLSSLRRCSMVPNNNLQESWENEKLWDLQRKQNRANNLAFSPVTSFWKHKPRLTQCCACLWLHTVWWAVAFDKVSGLTRPSSQRQEKQTSVHG